MEKCVNKTEKMRMRVSFDLDEVLFVDPATHLTEPELPFPTRFLFRERLRLGTPELIRTLQQMGFEVWVYTSSFRSERYIRSIFSCYRVSFDSIVNGQRHLKEVQAGHSETLPQKLPNVYKISLHIDDEAVVATYGREYGFNVYQLDAQDDEWKEKIIARVKQIRGRERPEEENE